MNPDELFKIAIELDLPSLLNWCQTNKRINEIICKRDPIWFYRLNQDFPDWKEFVLPKEITKPIDIYKYLYKLKKGKDMLKVGGSLLDYSKLTILDLPGNRISKIPETLPPNLKVLILSHNLIKEIPKTLPNLQELYLNDNKIKEIPEILPANLQELDLTNNSISEIPETLPHNLQELDLTNNPLTKKVIIPGVRVYQ